nr:hypothetical protein [uncultured Rhodoferax sp.]
MTTRAKQRVIATENEVLSGDDPFFAQMRAYEEAAEKALSDGVPALRRLVSLCESSDTGQARAVARLLAGLYNAHAFPFQMNQLRALDLGIHTDCIAAISLDSIAPQQEVHEYFENGNRRFQCIFKKFGIEPV